MAEGDPGRKALVAQEVKRVLLVLLADHEPTPAMRTILHVCLLVLMERDGSNLLDLQRFLNDKINADLVMLGCKHHHPPVAQFFQSEFRSPDYRLTKR